MIAAALATITARSAKDFLNRQVSKQVAAVLRAVSSCLLVISLNFLRTLPLAGLTLYKSTSKPKSPSRNSSKAGFDMKKLSIVGRDYHTDENVVGYYNTGDRMKYWGKLGAFWGGFWGLLFGSAFFLIPGVGPLLVAGPLVGWIVGALEGAVVVGGLSALGAGSLRHGHPKDSILQYETAVKSGKICPDRPRLRCGNGSRARNHQSHQSGRRKICGVSMICEHPKTHSQKVR
jgi:hypothetical protein